MVPAATDGWSVPDNLKQGETGQLASGTFDFIFILLSLTYCGLVATRAEKNAAESVLIICGETTGRARAS